MEQSSKAALHKGALSLGHQVFHSLSLSGSPGEAAMRTSDLRPSPGSHMPTPLALAITRLSPADSSCPGHGKPVSFTPEIPRPVSHFCKRHWVGSDGLCPSGCRCAVIPGCTFTLTCITPWHALVNRYVHSLASYTPSLRTLRHSSTSGWDVTLHNNEATSLSTTHPQLPKRKHLPPLLTCTSCGNAASVCRPFFERLFFIA